MASPQPADSHTRLSNELYSQILMRDFSKRQRAILDLIIRLSYGCGHKTALIPMTKHFSICGVPVNKVRRELDSLRDLNVIGFVPGVYWLNKDYDQWGIASPEPETERMFGELLRDNIGRMADQNGHAQNGHDDQKGHQNMTETGSNSRPKRSYDFPEIPRGSKDEEVPITKDNYIDKKIVSINSKVPPTDTNQYLMEMIKYGHEVFQPYGISQSTAYSLAELLVKEQLPKELGAEAIQVAKRLNKDEGFSVTKLRRWLQSGVKDVYAAREYEDKNFSGNRHSKVTGGQQPSGGYQRNQGDDGRRAGEDWAQIEAQFYK